MCTHAITCFEYSRLCCAGVLDRTSVLWGRTSGSEAQIAHTLSQLACLQCISLKGSQAEVLNTFPLTASLGERHAGTAWHALQQQAGLLSCLMLKPRAAHTLSKELQLVGSTRSADSSEGTHAAQAQAEGISLVRQSR